MLMVVAVALSGAAPATGKQPVKLKPPSSITTTTPVAA